MSFWSCYRNKFRCKFLAPPVFDLTGVRYKIIKRNNINTLFKKELAKTGTGLKEGIHSQDEQYLLYSEDTIRKVSRLFPAMYNHQKFLSGKIDNAGKVGIVIIQQSTGHIGFTGYCLLVVLFQFHSRVIDLWE